MSKPPLTTPEYTCWLGELKSRIQSAWITAARSVNRELILLYWDIGQAIVEKQEKLAWGKSVVEQLSRDLQKEFSGLKGFSARNLWEMRRLFEIYSDSEFLRQAAAEIPQMKNRRQAIAKLNDNQITEQLKDFILELGYGFCFIGRQHRVALGKKEYFIDLLSAAIGLPAKK